MKTPLLALVLLAVAFTASGQQPAPSPPLISTTGTAVIRVAPDLADLSFQVEVRNRDLAAARKEQTDRAAKVLAALRAAGIAEADLQSSLAQISPDYSNDRGETGQLNFYRVIQEISCTLHDVKKAPETAAAALAAGATGMREPVLRTSQLRKYRDEARQQAISAAREKAVALSGALGARVGKPFSIAESADESYSGNFNRQVVSMPDAGEGDASLPTFAPGTVSVSATIKVSFWLE